MSTASGFSSKCKLWTYCLLCCLLGCQLCSGGLKGCIFLCLSKLSHCTAERWGWMVKWSGQMVEQPNWMVEWSECSEHSYGADFGANELSSLSWSLWYLACLPMTDRSPLNGAPVWGCKGILNGAVRGLNGGHMGQSYGTDLGTIELISSCQSFWYLACFSTTNGSPLNGAPAWGCKGFLNGAIQGLHGAYMGQSYRADFGTIEFSSSCWSFWHLTGLSMTDSSPLNGAEWGSCMGLEWGSHMGLILVPMDSSGHSASHQTGLCLEWSSWLQVMLDLDWTLRDWHLLLTAAQSLIV